MGNPPFSAGRRMGESQRQDMVDVAYDFPKNGDLDYVSLWYKQVLLRKENKSFYYGRFFLKNII